MPALLVTLLLSWPHAQRMRIDLGYQDGWSETEFISKGQRLQLLLLIYKQALPGLPFFLLRLMMLYVLQPADGKGKHDLGHWRQP